MDFDFVTFLSLECSEAVNDYLKYRNGIREKIDSRQIKVNEKQKVYSDNDYLFIVRHVPDEYLKTRDDRLRKLGDDGIIKLYRGISNRALKSAPRYVRNLIRSHNMRKVFNSAVLNAGADSFFIEYFMGHTLEDTKAAYFRANPDKLRDMYQKYIPFITI